MRQVRFTGRFLVLLQVAVWLGLSVGVAAAADSLAVYVATPEPGHRSIYELHFSLSRPLPPDAVFEIHLPPSLRLDEVKVVGSRAIDGGFRLRKQGSVLVVERTGRGHTLPAGKTVDLEIANFRNPRRLAAGLQVRVVVRSGGQSVADVSSSIRWARPPRVVAQ